MERGIGEEALMAVKEFPELKEALNRASKALPNVTWKKMFGCDAVFAKDVIFGLIWKTGRIGVKLPEDAEFNRLMDMKGSDPWKAGKMTMSHWVLVPESMHGKKAELGKWVTAAHALSALAPAKKKKT